MGKIKRIIITILTMMSVNYAFADSCLMIAPSQITKVECSSEKVITFHVLSTLLNEKKSLIVTSVGDGEIGFSVYLNNKKCDFKAVVSGEKLEIKGDKTIKVIPIDLPPELNNEDKAQ